MICANTPRYTRFTFSPRYGIFGFRVGLRYFLIKAPWCRPTFSEQEGLDFFLQLGFGWRYVLRDFETLD